MIDRSEDTKIFDVGTGKGHLAIAIAKTGRRCTAIDISAEENYIAKLNAIYFGVDNLIDFQLQDAYQMKFESNSYDAVLSAVMIHHLIHAELVLNEMSRVCKSNGRIIISEYPLNKIR